MGSISGSSGEPFFHVFPKASFFRSMAGGVPYGATEGSSMGPGWDHCFFTFSGSFLGTPFAPKTLLFARKNQHFEVHVGAQNGVTRGPKFSRFSSARVSKRKRKGRVHFWGPRLLENAVICKEKPTFSGPFWAPERGPPESRFFMFFPKASFFRSMAGGVPSGATEGSSMGPDWGPGQNEPR